MRIFLILCVTLFAFTSAARSQSDAIEIRNKDIARKFYQDLWLSNNTDRYALYVADEYVVHDTGDRKNVTEPAVEQKNIADFFWSNGELSGGIDYQIAEGDLVATRWTATLEPTTFFGKYVMGGMNIPIINVFRFNEEGKIVEIWNHRHDIDTGQTNRFLLKGIAIGLVSGMLISAAVAFGMRRANKRA